MLNTDAKQARQARRLEIIKAREAEERKAQLWGKLIGGIQATILVAAGLFAFLHY